jgi:hypothetical protein
VTRSARQLSGAVREAEREAKPEERTFTEADDGL